LRHDARVEVEHERYDLRGSLSARPSPITSSTVALSGESKFVESQQLPGVPYVRWTEMLRLDSIRVERPDDRRLLGTGARGRSPDVFEVVCDPEVLPEIFSGG
jgi:hypothetical protein